MQGGRLPAEQRQPALAMHSDLLELAAAQLAEAQIVLLPQGFIPARHFVRSHRSDAHLAQRDRERAHCLRYSGNGRKIPVLLANGCNQAA